jgi:hypothetical protein
MAAQFLLASTQKLSIANSAAIQNTHFGSICAWYYPLTIATGIGYEILRLSNNGSGRRLSLDVTGNGQPGAGYGALGGYARCLDADSLQQYFSANFIVLAGQWQHIGITMDYDAKVMRTYRNGSLDATSSALGTGTAPTSNTVSALLTIGDANGSNNINGYLDDVRVYNTLLSTANMTSIYNGLGNDGITTGLQHRYLLKEGNIGAAMPSGAGAILDKGALALNVTQTNNPTYVTQKINDYMVKGYWWFSDPNIQGDM